MRLTSKGEPIESPVCLLTNHSGPCKHHHCMLAHKHPQYFAFRIEDFYKKHEFTEFDVISGGQYPHLIPHKPVDADPGFEFFRQSMTAVIHLGGRWPSGLKTVPREHVEFRFVEHATTYPDNNVETHTTQWLPCLEVSEFAFYIGPISDQKGAVNE